MKYSPFFQNKLKMPQNFKYNTNILQQSKNQNIFGIKQHRDILKAAQEGSFEVYRIPVDPVFRKAQEASMAPQQYKERGRGLKDKTVESISKLESVIWD